MFWLINKKNSLLLHTPNLKACIIEGNFHINISIVESFDMEQGTVQEPKPKCWYVFNRQIELTKYCTSTLIPPLFLVLKMPSAFYVCCIY